MKKLKMKPEDIKLEVNAINKVAKKDKEFARMLGDKLHYDVLCKIANGECSNNKACAKMAIKVSDWITNG